MYCHINHVIFLEFCKGLILFLQRILILHLTIIIALSHLELKCRQMRDHNFKIIKPIVVKSNQLSKSHEGGANTCDCIDENTAICGVSDEGSCRIQICGSVEFLPSNSRWHEKHHYHDENVETYDVPDLSLKLLSLYFVHVV